MNMMGSAWFSGDGQYRYMLRRQWSMKKDLEPEIKMIMFIGLNPSTADAVKNDPTITRCINFAREWGYDGLYFGNLFAFRTPYVNELYQAEDPIGPENNAWLLAMSYRIEVVAAWGNHGQYMDRGKEVLNLLSAGHPVLHCMGFNNTKQPKHPLYTPRSSWMSSHFTKGWL